MKVAILGATGAVGRTMLRVLEDRHFPADEVVLLASPHSAGQRISWRGRDWPVAAPAPGVFRGCRLALFSAGAERSREWAPRATDEGAEVVDNSSAWRMDPEVPLVAAEVNPHRIDSRPRGIVANPNCATIQLVVALHALAKIALLQRVLVTTFQSVSGAGQKGRDALRAELAGRTAQESPFPARILDNVIPWIGPRLESGWNEEEEKIRKETRRILESPGLEIAATCVRVPVEVGHAVAVVAELGARVELEQAADAFETAPGVDFYGNDRDPLPAMVAGTDRVAVGRLRADPDRESVLHFWVVADNLRKGAATNAVQIAERIGGGST